MSGDWRREIAHAESFMRIVKQQEVCLEGYEARQEAKPVIERSINDLFSTSRYPYYELGEGGGLA